MTKRLRYLLLGILIIFLLQAIAQPALADEKIIIEYYYSKGCASCTILIPIFDEIEDIYEDEVVVYLKQVNEYNEEYKNYQAMYKNTTGSIISWPFAVISSDSVVEILPKQSINVSNIEKIINGFIVDTDIIDIDFLFWHFTINLDDFSLPVLTIILGGVDSFNPCVFFILIFLLNILLYARSKKRMLLIGSIFITFSAVIYFLFMVLMLQAVQLTVEAGITGIVVGCIALALGGINIKDFFYFKKGISISIPESKKPKIYKQMRNLLKTPKLSGVLIGTIVLALMVNSYELICSLTMPTIFLSRLAMSELSDIQKYLYMIIYNIIYVIPMIIIVLFFIFTLGKRKISQWQGRLLQLMSGIMMASFGAIFLIDVTILENVVVPILLLGFTLIATGLIAQLWKHFHKEDFETDIDNKIKEDPEIEEEKIEE